MGCVEENKGNKKARFSRDFRSAVTTVQEAVDTAQPRHSVRRAAELSGVLHGMGVARLIFDDIKDKEARQT